MLAEADAWGQVAPDRTLIASCLIMPYGGRIGWIAMVLTSASHRRQGLATANLRLAIERCAAKGLIAGLDATPAGREVYAPQGFEDALLLRRLVARKPSIPREAARAASIRLFRTADDLDRAGGLDAAVFGAGRRRLLTHLRESAPARALLAQSRGRLTHGKLMGFVLARPGRQSLHIGPLVAEDDGVARALLGHALADGGGPVSIDVPTANESFLAFLAAAGFSPARPFTRMYRGATGLVGDFKRCYAIAGPEFG
jgi:Acetyltransferase (GNAT) domain